MRIELRVDIQILGVKQAQDGEYQKIKKVSILKATQDLAK